MSAVLVVTDNAGQGKLYEQELAEEGYEVWSTKDWKEAVDAIAERRPDVYSLRSTNPPFQTAFWWCGRGRVFLLHEYSGA